MPIDSIFGKTIQLLDKSVDLRVKNHSQIAGNLANAETPGYTPRVLQFEDQLKSAADRYGSENDLSVTHPSHIPLKSSSLGLDRVEGTTVEVPSPAGRDNNGVELDAEMSRMAENQIMYSASIQLLARKFDSLRYAIKGGQ